MIGLAYDWGRELATCDERYYRWTQWIFLQIYNSWYDPEWRWTDAAGRTVVGAARPISELPIPPDVKAQAQPPSRLSRPSIAWPTWPKCR
jgi:leucyl-tRNA synthetase